MWYETQLWISMQQSKVNTTIIFVSIIEIDFQHYAAISTEIQVYNTSEQAWAMNDQFFGS